MKNDHDDRDAPVHANHHVQHQFPAKVRFCALCGAEMRSRVVLPDRKRRQVCSRCGFVYFPAPRLVAGCVIVDEAAGAVLLIKRGLEPSLGKWTFPGGFVEADESAADAALRETVEEVGMHVRLGPVLGVYSDLENAVSTVVTFLATPGAEAPTTSDEAPDVRYFARDAIPWDQLAFRSTIAALTDWAAIKTKGR
ncbi:MAG TPA: NUDIX hydrolase [Candidatus Binataceae bacterium]